MSWERTEKGKSISGVCCNRRGQTVKDGESKKSRNETAKNEDTVKSKPATLYGV